MEAMFRLSQSVVSEVKKQKNKTCRAQKKVSVKPSRCKMEEAQKKGAGKVVIVKVPNSWS